MAIYRLVQCYGGMVLMQVTNGYIQLHLSNALDKWVVFSDNQDFTKPKKAITFAFDTETITYYDGKQLDNDKLFKKIKNMTQEQIRKHITTYTWAWQCYDEINGFFMTNDFDEFLTYICRAGFKYGWCYNSTFDFSQIDYQILGVGCDKWKMHVKQKDGEDYYNKSQPFTYESLHNNMGARYVYKIWYEYKNAQRHLYTHSFEVRDFMKFITGGLAKLLSDFDVKDNEGQPIRKLQMNYQLVDYHHLTNDEINYCCNDVKGLYFAIKQFNHIVEEQSGGDYHIFGRGTNLITAGGFAKRMLLKSLYPDKLDKWRNEAYQKDHPITIKQDEYIRNNHLYRGGISYVNPVYQGHLIRQKMYRYDVNSEYPYAMANIRDLIGKPKRIKYSDWLEYDDDEKSQYECIYILKQMYGHKKKNMLGIWYDPFKKEYVDDIYEDGIHLIFEEEFDEMLKWYDDIEYDIDEVIIVKRGDYAYRPFVEKNYELKRNAKLNKNPTLTAYAKLILNSSYGKLSERVERVKCHYELNNKTGAVHLVGDDVEISQASMMNVLIGAKITSFARVYILSKIREITHNNPAKYFVYIDTDSIHTFKPYDKADAISLGGLKLEVVCEAIKYIAPKTYIDIFKINKNGTIDDNQYEVHSKGISNSAIKLDWGRKQKYKKHNKITLELVDKKFDYNVKYLCLIAMNVPGGKCLLPMLKYLAREELRPDEFVYSNYGGYASFIEL